MIGAIKDIKITYWQAWIYLHIIEKKTWSIMKAIRAPAPFIYSFFGIADNKKEIPLRRYYLNLH